MNSIEAGTRNMVWDYVRDRILDSMWKNSWDVIRYQVKDDIWNVVEYGIRVPIGDSLESFLWNDWYDFLLSYEID